MLSKSIEHFLCVYERNSLSLAAATLGLTQPALTKSIRLLEQSLGVALFDRRAGGMLPTAHGKRLAIYASSTQSAWRIALAELQDSSANMTGELRLGAGLVWSLRLMPQLLTVFQREYPRLCLSLETEVADQLLPKLMAGELDLILGTIDGCVESDDVVVLPLKKTRLGAFVRQGHPLAATTSLHAKELPKYRWAAHTHDRMGPDAVQAYFHRQNVAPRGFDLRCSSLTSLLAAVEVSDAIAFISADVQQEAFSRGIVPLSLSDSDIWTFDTGIAYRRSLGVMVHMQRVITLISEAVHTV